MGGIRGMERELPKLRKFEKAICKFTILSTKSKC